MFSRPITVTFSPAIRVTITTIFTPVQYIRVADLVTSVSKMRGGPSTSVLSAIAIATNAVRIMSGSSRAAQDAVSYAPLPFRGGRYFGDLESRVGLPPKR